MWLNLKVTVVYSPWIGTQILWWTVWPILLLHCARNLAQANSGIGRKCHLTLQKHRVGKMWSCNKIMFFCPYSIHIIQANLMNTKTSMLVFGKSLEGVFDYLKKTGKEHGTKYWPWIWYLTSNHLFDLSTVFFFQKNPNEKMNMNLSWSVYSRTSTVRTVQLWPNSDHRLLGF